MAISSYPTPADAGVLFTVLANTAITISIFKETVRSILSAIGIHVPPWDEFSVDHSRPTEGSSSPSRAHTDEFRSQTPAKPCDLTFACDQDCCSICLVEFEPDCRADRLSCGHVFHSSCLDKWLDYWNTTCPLCRNFLAPMEEDESNACSSPPM